MAYFVMIFTATIIAAPAIKKYVETYIMLVKFSREKNSEPNIAPAPNKPILVPNWIAISASLVGISAAIINLVRFPDVLSNKWDIAIVSFTVFFGIFMAYFVMIFTAIIAAAPAVKRYVETYIMFVKFSREKTSEPNLAPHQKTKTLVPIWLAISASLVGISAAIINLVRFPDVLSNKWDIAFVAFTVFFGLLNLFGFIANLYEWFRERR